ncbi:hypothetical protein F5Y19DRAFT_7513 [Xylariaceae sp. FL1651]|nr:hypothetical protein F5Y19DRAFT_7513 [Xylariaceae sp. FL1651]
MSVFSIIKRGRAQAKEHGAKQVEKVKDEAVKLPYKHVPTHAAIDAMATAPASWKHDDRPKILEQNRRRSAMASSGTSLSGLPRVGSSLSCASYPPVYANPVVPLPKNYSYSSIPSSWREKMGNTPEGVEGLDYFSQPGVYRGKGKGKEVVPRFIVGAASPMLSSGRASPLSGRAVPVSVGGSSGNSSEDEKETRQKALRNASYNPDFKPYLSHTSSATRESLHRLHPAHARRRSETSTQTPDRHYPPQAKSTYFAAPRPISRRTLSLDVSVPPVPALPEQFITRHAPSSSTSSIASIGMAVSTAPTSVVSTPAPSTAGDPTSSEPTPLQAPTTDMTAFPIQTRKFLLGESPRISTDTIVPASNELQAQTQSQRPPTSRRRLSKTGPRPSTEAERPLSVNTGFRVPSEAVQLKKPSAAATEAMVHELNRLEPRSPQSYFEPYATPAPQVPRRRLSKDQPATKDQNGKKHRWSLWGRRNSMTAA